MIGKRERLSSEELHKNDAAVRSAAPAKKKKKLDEVIPSGKDEKGLGGGKPAKSILDLVQLSVAKEELRGKKKKRDKLKNKKKLRKANPADSGQPPRHTNGDSAKSSAPQGTNKPGKNVSIASGDHKPNDMSGTDKKMMLETKQQAKVKKFGSWFPSAFTVKGGIPVVTDTISIVLFYQYVEPPWSEDRKQQVLQFTIDKGAELGLGGRARIAREGVNCTISGTQEALESFAAALRRLDRAFEATDFKYIRGLAPAQHFAALNVFPVRELVTYGIKDASLAPLSKGGVHLPPEEFHAAMERPRTVLIDVRNYCESCIGNFNPATPAHPAPAPPAGKARSKGKARAEGQAKAGPEADGEGAAGGGAGRACAELIDPKMRQSTDFPDWLARPETREQLAGKTVLMYCTGGIRCERASSLLKQKLGDQVEGVFQLQGGIEKYLLTYPDGGHWRGLNFAFDKRTAVAPAEGAADRVPLGRCCLCGEPWDTYLGKRKCVACDSPVLVCLGCCGTRRDKAPGADLRCPLCVEEGRTTKERSMHHEVTLKAQTTTALLRAQMAAAAAASRKAAAQRGGTSAAGGSDSD